MIGHTQSGQDFVVTVPGMKHASVTTILDLRRKANYLNAQRDRQCAGMHIQSVLHILWKAWNFTCKYQDPKNPRSQYPRSQYPWHTPDSAVARSSLRWAVLRGNACSNRVFRRMHTTAHTETSNTNGMKNQPGTLAVEDLNSLWLRHAEFFFNFTYQRIHVWTAITEPNNEQHDPCTVR